MHAALATAVAIVLAVLFVPVSAANPGTPFMASTNTPVASNPTRPVVNGTLVPLATALPSTGEASGPFIVTLQPAHVPTGTPPRGANATPSLHSSNAGTPRTDTVTVVRPISSPAKGPPTLASRPTATAQEPAFVPIAPMIVETPIPTLATLPTALPTAATVTETETATPEIATATPDTATATPETATATRDAPAPTSVSALAPQEAPATPTLMPRVDVLPTVAVATPDLAPNGGRPPLGAQADPPALAQIQHTIRMVMAVAFFVLVLGTVGVVSGIVTMVRARRILRE